MATYPHKLYQIGPGLNAMFIKSNLTATIVRSPDAEGDVFIPRSVKHKFKQYAITRIDDEAFYQNTKIVSLSFANDSELESIGKEAFYDSSLKRLSIPASLKTLDPDWCRSTRKLEEVTAVSSRFAWVDNKFFIGKSKEDGEFDTLLLAGRKIQGAVAIPASIKYIGTRAFQWCEKIQSVSFNTIQLEELGYGAFNNCANLEKVLNIPSSLKVVDYGCFCGDTKLNEVSFQGENVILRQDSFSRCLSLTTFSLPNAMKITIDLHAFHDANANFTMYVPPWAEINGQGASEIDSRIEHYAHEEVKNKVASIPNSISAPVINNLVTQNPEKYQACDSNNLYNVNQLLKRIRILEDKLSKYEQVSTFDMNGYKTQLIEDSFNEENRGSDDDYEVDKSSSNDNDMVSSSRPSNSEFVIGDDEEKSFTVISKAYEDDISITYKVLDNRFKNIVFKKIIKENENLRSETYLSNAVRRFKILHAINHPCIIRAIAINTNERITNEEMNKNEPRHSKKDHRSRKIQVTTAFYFEYLEFSLKEVIHEHFLSNTLKARIAIEVASGISHLHHRGMIIHDLNPNRIKLNGVFNAKIVSFGVHDASSNSADEYESEDSINEADEFKSPEIASKKNFDVKTDVFSYGILLHYIFAGSPPSQSLQDRIDGKPIKLSNPSKSISSFCLDMIRKCISFKPEDRPTMDDVLNEIRENSYNLAAEVENEVVLTRHRALNRFESAHRPLFQLS